MADISANIDKIRQQLPPSVKLVAVSKTKPVSDILEAFNNNQLCFGENRVQELLWKKEVLPTSIEWHMIGHLQTNKVKMIVPFIDMIQSVDSFKLLKAINIAAFEQSRKIKCLLQVCIASEETKFGFSIDEIDEMLNTEEFWKLDSVSVAGVMGMATLTNDSSLIRKEFKYLAHCFDTLKNNYFKENDNFREISMGMSGDYSIAVEEGSTIVRIGSLIFGSRNLK